MAFNNITKVLYGGSIRITYLDGPHFYYKQDRVNYDLSVDDPRAWGKKTRPKGTTTLLDETLEKKGLMTWPMGLALGELFGFYNFKNDQGEKMIGFSIDRDTGLRKGTLWDSKGRLINGDQDSLADLLKSASEAWMRKKQKGADIGSIVHSAIEHYVTNKPFIVLDEYTKGVMGASYETEYDKAVAISAIPEDVRQANEALKQFKKWWTNTEPELIGTEDLIYSKEHDVAGTFDAIFKLDGKIILCDWKTSAASTSREANSPQGVYYSYFIQSAIYALAWEEMGNGLVDDLMILSARKDGGFDTLLASDLGLSMQDLLSWARAVITSYRFMSKTKDALWKSGVEAGRVK